MSVRRATTVLAALALALAGCGGGGGGGGAEAERTAAAPAQTAAPSPSAVPSPAAGAGVRARLAAGELGVVDFARRALVAPAAMRPNKEQTLTRLRWRGWGGPSATATGRVRTLVCDPSCAEGRIERATAELTLSEPRACGGARYYAAGRLTVGGDAEAGRRPAVFLLTPC